MQFSEKFHMCSFSFLAAFWRRMAWVSMRAFPKFWEHFFFKMLRVFISFPNAFSNQKQPQDFSAVTQSVFVIHQNASGTLYSLHFCSQYCGHNLSSNCILFYNNAPVWHDPIHYLLVYIMDFWWFHCRMGSALSKRSFHRPATSYTVWASQAGEVFWFGEWTVTWVRSHLILLPL